MCVISFSLFAMSPTPSSKHVHACISEFIKVLMHNFHFQSNSRPLFFQTRLFCWLYFVNCVCRLQLQKNINCDQKYLHKIMKLLLRIFDYLLDRFYIVVLSTWVCLTFSKKQNKMYNLKQDDVCKMQYFTKFGEIMKLFSHRNFSIC